MKYLPPHYSLPRAHSCALSRELASRRADARRCVSSLMGDHVFCWRSCGAACHLGWSAWRNAKPRCKRVYIYTSADIHSEPSNYHATQCKYSRMECWTWVCHPWVASYRWWNATGTLFPIVKSFQVILWKFTIVHVDVLPCQITLLRVFLE